MIMSTWLKENDDEGHDRLYKTKLKRCLFTETQEADGVSLSS